MHSAYIREVPNATGAVLMLHGICSTPRHFDWLIPAIPADWAVYNLLLDGHGGTVADFAHTSMAKWKAQTRAALADLCARFPRVVIVGFSMGTLLAIDALEGFDGVCGLLLLNVPLRPWVRLRMIWRSLRFIHGRVNTADVHEAACAKDVSITLQPGVWRYVGWLPRFAELLVLCRRCRKTAAHISVPCYAFFGRRDELVSLRSVRYFGEHAAVTVFDGAGHFYFPPENCEEVRKALAALLA